MLLPRLVLLGDRDERLFTHRELAGTIPALERRVRVEWVDTDAAAALETHRADGIWVIPGSPYRNDDVVFGAIESARITGQPFLGTCGGFQYAAIEYARNVVGLRDAAHAETASTSAHQLVSRLSCGLVGQERLVTPVNGTLLARLSGTDPFVGFHWCNFGVAPAYQDVLTRGGLVVSATAQDAGAEAIELPTHPFFLATLFQPQVGAGMGRPLHPVIEGFIQAVVARFDAERPA